ncbi:MAG: hypothetical protein MUC50_07220 [Myxococcota bacterium]|jgi:hypothetical protein|nr:hypothetical protein [Myxococcota bacterium]
MSELSHFEAESAKTPKFQPYAIIGGSIFMLLAMWAISVFSPTDAVKDMKNTKAQNLAAEAAPIQDADVEDDDE